MESNDKLEELLQQMYAVEETPIDVDKEWRKFEAKHFKRQHPLLRVVAIFIGILMLSGITYAAIHLMRGNAVKTEKPVKQETTTTISQHKESVPVDTLAISAFVSFENTPLDSMLTEIAAFYNNKVDIRNEAIRDLRLYYRWDYKADINTVIEDLNNFEQLHLVLEDNTIIAQ